MIADSAPERTNSLTRAAVSDALAAFMSGGWTPASEPPAAEPAEVAAYCAKRRARLCARFPGERLVVPAGVAPTRSNDTAYRFRPGSDYAYLTGDDDEAAVLVLDGPDAVLYRRRQAGLGEEGSWRDARTGELWVGRRPSLRETALTLAIEVQPLEELEAALGDGRPTRLVRGLDPAADRLVPAATTQAPQAGDELAAACAQLRLVKDEWEIAQLQAAVDATVRGFADLVRALPRASGSRAVESGERYLEGVFSLRARVEGRDNGYLPIVAAGDHATILHWSANDGRVRPGDLVLVDAGVEGATGYTADVTRTLPVGGTFTPVQRRVYDLVHAAQEAGLARVRPGARFRDFHEAAIRVLVDGLVAWGLLPPEAADPLRPESAFHRRYTLCGTGHMLGLDVHDCAQARTDAYIDAFLEPGHVLTVEPGLYFQRDDLTVPEELRGIGVRIEDDVLVTADGCRMLSAALPRSAGAVEEWMRELLAGGGSHELRPG